MLNIAKLSRELIDAGISTDGNCNSSGVVWDDAGNEIQSRPDVAAIITAHTPGPSWADIRADRNARMKDCDWTQANDAVLTFTEKDAWADYRQALRDVPQTYATPDAVIWPEVPNG